MLAYLSRITYHSEQKGVLYNVSIFVKVIAYLMIMKLRNLFDANETRTPHRNWLKGTDKDSMVNTFDEDMISQTEK
jgi:hypothetical protein